MKILWKHDKICGSNRRKFNQRVIHLLLKDFGQDGWRVVFIRTSRRLQKLPGMKIIGGFDWVEHKLNKKIKLIMREKTIKRVIFACK